MITIAEVRKNIEIWERSVYNYMEQALLKYDAEHSNFSNQSVKEIAYMINKQYSTRLSYVDLSVIADGISAFTDIKDKLDIGDISLVKKISILAQRKNGSQKTYQSFASKFCYMYNTIEISSPFMTVLQKIFYPS